MRILGCFIALYDSVVCLVNVGCIQKAAFTRLASRVKLIEIPSSNICYHADTLIWCQWLTEILNPFIEARTATIPFSHSSGHVSSTPFLLFSSPEMFKKGLNSFLKEVEDSNSRELFFQCFVNLVNFTSRIYRRYTCPEEIDPGLLRFSIFSHPGLDGFSMYCPEIRKYFYDDSHEQWDKQSLFIDVPDGLGWVTYCPKLEGVGDISGPFRWENGIRIAADGRRIRIKDMTTPRIRVMVDIQTAGNRERMVYCCFGVNYYYSDCNEGTSSKFYRLRVIQQFDTIDPAIICAVLTSLENDKKIDSYFTLQSTINEERGTRRFVLEMTFPSINGRIEANCVFVAVRQVMINLLPWESPHRILHLIFLHFEAAAKESQPGLLMEKIAANFYRLCLLERAERSIFLSNRHHVPPGEDISVPRNTRPRSKSCTLR